MLDLQTGSRGGEGAGDGLGDRNKDVRVKVGGRMGRKGVVLVLLAGVSLKLEI